MSYNNSKTEDGIFIKCNIRRLYYNLSMNFKFGRNVKKRKKQRTLYMGAGTLSEGIWFVPRPCLPAFRSETGAVRLAFRPNQSKDYEAQNSFK
jgi:hypothetical protein